MRDKRAFIYKYKDIFLQSALSKESLISMDDFFIWFEKIKNKNVFNIIKKPVSQLKGWIIDDKTGSLNHQTGKFFSVEGLEINTDFGMRHQWTQPIVIQPEYGILGFITKRINGLLHFLVQAKMEPGNINIMQISPTLQATRSNFMQVHGGIKPLYLDYFLNPDRSKVLMDQLQSEKNSYFYKKRNRNIIIMLDDNESMDIHDDFCWLTLAQIFILLKTDNIVNMEARTVLSGIVFSAEKNELPCLEEHADSEFCRDALKSAFTVHEKTEYNMNEILRRIASIKFNYKLNTNVIPLNKVNDWEYDGNEIFHKEKKYFSVIGAAVSASTREVKSWDQPLIESARGGIVCFICSKINGILHFLVQIMVEPGNFDIAEMAATLQFNPNNSDLNSAENLPPFYSLFNNAGRDSIKYDSMQSDEGGRFYHDMTRYVIIQCSDDQINNRPENFIWMTIGQVKELLKYNNYFNIEARSLLSCIGFSD